MTMHFIVYRVTNTVNGKIYVGCHKTANVDDGYMGSGHALAKAFEKYGRANFVKEVLFDFPTADEMFSKEQELVELGPHSYNLKRGGQRGSYGYKHTPEVVAQLKAYRHSPETIAKFSASKKGKLLSPEIRAAVAERNRALRLGKPVPEERRARIAAALKGRVPWNKGLPQSEEIKAKKAAALKPETRLAAAERLRGNQFRKGHKWTEEERAAMTAARWGPKG